MDTAWEFQERKREALIRRGRQLIGWLHQPNYTQWKDHDTTLHLAKMINLTIWAFERSIPPDQWEPFKKQLINARYLILDIFETDEAEMTTYAAGLIEVENALTKYIEYVKTAESLPDYL